MKKPSERIQEITEDLIRAARLDHGGFLVTQQYVDAMRLRATIQYLDESEHEIRTLMVFDDDTEEQAK